MLVIISDLHLTDGSSGETINSGAFKLFRDRLSDLAYDASWRPNDKYVPLESLDLILLGDILDVIRSDKWLADKTRPWNSPNSAQFQKKIESITDLIIKNNDETLKILKSLQGGITIPEATAAAQPRKVSRDPDAPHRQPVKVNIHYMVGNHDWFYHLPGKAYDAIRKKVVAAMGLANPPTRPFPHEAEESAEIEKTFREHGVYARHGDIYDPWNFDGQRDASSLGDAIVVELLNRFPTEVKKVLGNRLSQGCLDGLKELDNVRPLHVIPAWIGGLLTRTCAAKAEAQEVKEVWNDLVDQFLSVKFVRDHDKWMRVDLVDQLQLGLKISKGVSLQNLDRLISWWNKVMTEGGRPFHQHALREREFKNRNARHVVYGHTHRHEIIPLDACVKDNAVFNQFYLNSGTWRRVHERAQSDPKEQEFMGYHVMTYLAFFKDGERRGRTFDSWSGALGVG